MSSILHYFNSVVSLLINNPINRLITTIAEGYCIVRGRYFSQPFAISMVLVFCEKFIFRKLNLMLKRTTVFHVTITAIDSTAFALSRAASFLSLFFPLSFACRPLSHWLQYLVQAVSFWVLKGEVIGASSKFFFSLFFSAVIVFVRLQGLSNFIV